MHRLYIKFYGDRKNTSNNDYINEAAAECNCSV